MSFVGLSLGLIGSLHCIMMCGPLVLGVSKVSQASGVNLISHAIKYNFGRVSAYVLLGLGFAMIGEVFALVGFQRILSLVTGVILILLILFSMNIETTMLKSSKFQMIYKHYLDFITSKLTSLAKTKPVFLGFLNGLLPCGMVYVALAGALTSASVVDGMLFMLSFGLGTLPMLFTVMVGAKWVLRLKAFRIKNAITIGQLILGIYLVARGLQSSADSIAF